MGTKEVKRFTVWNGDSTKNGGILYRIVVENDMWYYLEKWVIKGAENPYWNRVSEHPRLSMSDLVTSQMFQCNVFL